MRFEGSILRKQSDTSGLKNVDNTQTVELQIVFFGGRRDWLPLHFTGLENDVTV